MAQFDYSKIAGIAADILTDFHQGTTAAPIKFIKITPGTGPAQNPGPDSETVTVLTGAVVQGVPARYVAASLAQEGDLQVTMKVGEGVPAVGDKFEIGGIRYRVISPNPIPATGVVIVYKPIVRR